MLNGFWCFFHVVFWDDSFTRWSITGGGTGGDGSGGVGGGGGRAVGESTKIQALDDKIL